MEIKIIREGEIEIAEVVFGEVAIHETQDILDVMGNADYQGARCVLMHEKHFISDFFDLKTGIAGEILQKFSNYKMKLAIAGDFTKYKSKALQAFIIECNRGDAIFFVSDRDEGIRKLTES